MSQAFGPYGSFGEDYNTHKVLTCPAGSYIVGLTGRAGPNVNKVDTAVCRDVATGAQTTLVSQAAGATDNQFGTTGAENPVTIFCSGTDGLTGLHLVSDGEVNGMQGTCRQVGRTDAGNDYYTGKWGTASNWNHDDRCASLLFQVEGGRSNHGGSHNVTNLRYACKDFAAMQALAADPARRGACAVGDDSSPACAELKGSLGRNAADVAAYCSVGLNAGNDNCQKYYNGDRSNSDYRTLMKQYCAAGDNWQTAVCKDYCTAADSGATMAKADCDAIYRAKCDPATNPKNAKLPLCSCLQPWTSYSGHNVIDLIPGAPQRASCYFDTCIQYGYRPQVDSSQQCPVCIQNSVITVTNAQADIRNIAQTCNVNTNGVTAAPSKAPAALPDTATATTTATATAALSAPTSLSGVTAVAAAGILLLLLLVLSLGAALLWPR